MKNNTKNYLTRSFIIVPMLVSSLSMSTVTASVQSAMLAKDQSSTIEVISPEEAALQANREETAAKIDAYFGQYNLPLTGYGMTMVLAGEKYDVDPLLIAGLAMRESTGCKHYIRGTYNCFGWGGGKIKFASFEEAINVVAMKLGTHKYYKGKSTHAKLQTYNPPSVVANYAGEVMGIMKKIDSITV